jgi:hypothetical protein
MLVKEKEKLASEDCCAEGSNSPFRVTMQV